MSAKHRPGCAIFQPTRSRITGARDFGAAHLPIPSVTSQRAVSIPLCPSLSEPDQDTLIAALEG